MPVTYCKAVPLPAEGKEDKVIDSFRKIQIIIILFCSFKRVFSSVLHTKQKTEETHTFLQLNLKLDSHLENGY